MTVARYAYVAVVQMVDPADPQRWEVTGDAVGPDVTSEDKAVHYMVHGDHGLVQSTGIPPEHLQVICWSAFEVTWPDT